MSSSPAFWRLPSEILQQITSYLDSPSAASFSLLSRQCASIAKPILWRDIDLTPKSGANDSLRRKTKTLMRHRSPRWDLVRTIKASLLEHIVHSLFQLLENASDNLVSLEINGETPDSLDDLDLRLLYCGPELYFPVLTHLRLVNVFHNHEFILYLGTMMPNLTSLDIEIDNRGAWIEEPESRLDRDFLPWNYRSATTDVLERLRVVYIGPYILAPFESHVRPPQQDPSTAYITDNIIDLICGLRLRQLCLSYTPPREVLREGDIEPLREFVVGLSELCDLRWETPWAELPVANELAPLAKLERLILTIDWSETVEDLPQLPQLRVILFECSKYSTTPTFRSPSRTRILDADLDTWFRSNPQLRVFHFSSALKDDRNLGVFANLDGLESSDVTCTISSFCHGLQEVLHVRLLLQDIGQCSGVGEGDRVEWRTALYVENEGGIDGASGTTRSVPKFEIFTDFEGKAVPLELLERMRKMEGISEQGWAERGVEVGDEAWKLLTDWQQGGPMCELRIRLQRISKPNHDFADYALSG